MDESALRIFWHDDAAGYWVLVSDSRPDTANKLVTGTVDHFTLFSIFSYTGSGGALQSVSSYPNPFASLKGEKARIHYNLGADGDVRIRIFNPAGLLVWEQSFNAGNSGGRAGPNEILWDGKTGDGRSVGRGIYLAVLEYGGEKTVIKIGVR